MDAGKCKTNGWLKKITINKKHWNRLDSLQKELLIFHELGHCILGRGHRNEKFPNDECISILDGKEEGFDCSNNYYSPSWRTYYLDELFDPFSPIPEWYSSEQTYLKIEEAKEVLFNKSGTEIYAVSRFGNIPRFNLSKRANFQIDLEAFPREPMLNANLHFNALDFSFSNRNGKVYIKQNNSKPESFFYYRIMGPTHRESIKLTIRKQAPFLYFFIDERLLHVMDADYYCALNEHLPNLPCQTELVHTQNYGKEDPSRLSIFLY